MAAFCLLVVLATVVLATGSENSIINVLPNNQFANWTNATGMGYYTVNLTLSNTTNITVFNIINTTSAIVNSLGVQANFMVIPNDTMAASNGPLSVTLNFTTDALLPGRYNGTVMVWSNSTENASVAVTLDVPLNVNTTTGVGNISGFASSTGGVNPHEYFYVNMSRVNAYGMRVNLTGANESHLVTMTPYNGASTNMGIFNFLNQGNSTGFNYTYSSVQAGYWLLDFQGQYNNTAFNASVELLESSLNSNGTVGTITVINRTNRGYSDNVNLYFWLNNSADYDVNITSVINDTNLSSGSGFMNVTSVSIPSGFNLSANSANLVNVIINVNTSNTGNVAGNYVGWVNFTSDRGYPNSTLSVMLIVNLTNLLDVSTPVFANLTGGGLWIIPGNNATITLVPRFQNGTILPSLGSFSTRIKHQSYGQLVGSTTIRDITITNNSANCDGSACTFNSMIPSNALGGNYTVYATVSDSSTLNSGTVSNSTHYLTVNQTALKVSLHDPAAPNSDITSFSMANGTTKRFYINVTNFGALNATGVTVNRSAEPSSTCGTIYDCSSYVTLVSLGTIMPGENRNSSWDNYCRFVAGDVTTSCTITITADTSTPGAAWDRQVVNLTFSVTKASSGGTTSSSGGGGGSGNSSNTTSATLGNDITLLSWPHEMQIEQGARKSSIVSVKNTGTMAQMNVKVSVEGLNSSWWTVSDPLALMVGFSREWDVGITVPNSSAITNYSVTFVASNDNISARATGKVIVIPGAAARTVISANFTNYTSRLAIMLERLKGVPNSTTVNSTLQEAQRLINLANASIEAGNWIGAFNALKAADAKLGEAEKAFSGATGMFSLPGVGGDLPLIVGIGGGIAAVAGAAFYYLRRKGIIKVGSPWREHKKLRHERLSGSWKVQRAKHHLRQNAIPWSHRLSPRHFTGQLGSLFERIGEKMERADKRRDYHWKPKKKRKFIPSVRRAPARDTSPSPGPSGNSSSG